MNNKISKTIKILEEIKDSRILNSEANESIEKTLNKVNSIYNENTVKVSILGEFSSGKSTFINGILKENILSYGDEPTTAINTVIKYGEKPSINVNFENGKKKRINKNQIKSYIKEGEIKNKCSTLEIFNNNSYLKDGLVIIDTPGANINKPDHNLQRKKAIKESSVGVFLISCQSLTSNSFIEFLKENKNNLQKIIFVLTKVDIYEDNDISIDMDNKTPKQKLNSAKEYITNVIREYGGIKRPKVHTVSAKSFIEKNKLKIIDVEKSFNKLVEEIRHLAIMDKDRIIEREIEKNLDEIIKALNYLLEKKDNNCRKEIEKINGNIEEFDSFIYSITEEFKESLNNEKISKKNIVRERMQINKTECYENIEYEIERIDSLSSFKSKANKVVNSEYKKFTNKCEIFINEEINDFGIEQFKLVEEKLKEYFKYIEKTYEHLGIQKSIRIRTITVSFIASIISYFILSNLFKVDKLGSFIVAIVLFSIAFLVQRKNVKFSIPYEQYFKQNINYLSSTEFVSNEGIDDSHVAGGGLLIGAFLGGPLGAIVGAGIGALVGGLFFKDKLRKAKRGLLEAVEGDLINYVNRLSDKANINLNQKAYQLEINLNEYIKENKNLYSELLNGIKEYNKGMFLKLTETQKLSKKFIKELKMYMK